MKFYIEKIIFKNKAPFDSLDLNFKENEIAILTAINGSGKTTILSHITDAWYEIAKISFSNSTDDKYYRLSDSIYNLNPSKASFFYIRFKFGSLTIDFIDIRNKCSEEEYNSAINIENKIPFEEIESHLQELNHIKYVSTNVSKSDVDSIFNKNIVTYFPSYRYEIPGYLNENFKFQTNFKKLNDVTGNLKNPIEVVSGLPELINWVMDVALDAKLEFNGINSKYLEDYLTIENLNQIITKTLSSKNLGKLKLIVGPRILKGTRLQVVKESTDYKLVYPSLFNLSSGESALFTMFGEILRQADNLEYNIKLSNINGIVLIDEIDKHLHIKLQKEVIPSLLYLFPNVQFILSSHSPFLSLGIEHFDLKAEYLDLSSRTKIIDLDNKGIYSKPSNNDLYAEVYEMMISENERFKQMFEDLNTKISESEKPLIITEGKTDIIHLKTALEKLKINDLDIEFYDENNTFSGDADLEKILMTFSKISISRKIIGIFDRDDDKYVKEIESNGDFKKYSNNVYGICIPLVNNEIYGKQISIEHYYQESILKKEDINGRRLFLGYEFHSNSNSKCGKFETKSSKIQNKVEKNGVIDEKVYKKIDLEHKKNIALSKSDFANLIKDPDFNDNFDFETFRGIFDKIKDIINSN
jgi:predicted ATP-binding protein involved in virulence